MKLHLPVLLHKALLASFSVVALYTEGKVIAADLTLGRGDSLSINYSEVDSIPDLENGTLQLNGDTVLHLANCGEGDGKTYTLLTGVSRLLDAAGNELALESSNNSAALYFDTSKPGVGFWSASKLQFTTDGKLQLVRHEQMEKAVEVGSNYTSTGNGAVFSGTFTLSLPYWTWPYDYAGGDGRFVDVSLQASFIQSNIGNVQYSENAAYNGGVIYGETISLSSNGNVLFRGNSASNYGGAICGYDFTETDYLEEVDRLYPYKEMSEKDENPRPPALGVIPDDCTSTITLNNNGSMTFSGNTASSGGAIYGGEDSTITLSGNGSVTFSENTASYGGAIYGYGSTIELSGNESVTFSGNRASSGGAIYGGEDSTITLSGNGSVTFSGNTASSGGAIYGCIYSTIELSGNGSVTFSDNFGCAIYGNIYSTIELSGNGSVTFSGNSGRAIYGGEDSTITLSGNDSVTFSGNSGCAICGNIYSTIELSGNDSVEFSGNTASASDGYTSGGAIRGYGNLNIRNNDSVLFERNAEVQNETYRLRSIYAGGSGDVISLSAAAGKSIEFRDSVYIDSGSTVELNADYTDANGVVHKQTGDIIFTGAYTEQHLNELLAADGAERSATAEEILSSCTTEVNAMTNLYGGHLRVEDGAVYKGYGITAHEGSAATVLVKDAELNHVGYELTFHAGSTLELAGDNVISGNVRMQEGSTLRFDVRETKGISRLTGNLEFTEGSHILVFNEVERVVENEILLFMKEGSLSGWDTDTLTIQNSIDGNAADIRWINGDLLVLNYNEENFQSGYFQGDVVHTTCQKGDVHLKYYNSVSFANLTSSSGGAIYGGSNSTIMLSDNGSVEFIGNTASYSSFNASGGAIYGYGSTIELSGNGSVEFIGNTVSSSYSFYANTSGGAIYGGSNSTITLSDNGSVEFIGNTASASSFKASGGAIFGYGDSKITLSDNGSVMFSGNTVTASSAYGGALYCGKMTLSGNGSVRFSGNTVTASSAYGGALYCSKMTLNDEADETYSGGSVELSGNEVVEFSGNTVTASGEAYGGAIYGYGDSTMTLSDNGCVWFSENTASGWAYGGAIYGGDDSTIVLSGNESVTFSGNTASSASSVAYGGAIYTTGNLSIRNNDSVLFEKNAENSGEIYRLRSIYAGGSGDVISLSAVEGKSIEFRDSVYVASGSTVELNADYTDANGVVHKQTGDIIFTGAYTEQHLNELLATDGAERSATAEEILSSRTTEVYAMTNLYGGRLRVEDGAVYKGYGITAHEGSAATVRVKDAMLNHRGYELIFNSGSTLELAGENTISGDVQLLSGSKFHLNFADAGAGKASLTLNDSLTMKSGSVLQVSYDAESEATTEDKVTLQGSGRLVLNGMEAAELFALGTSWSGTVALSNISVDTNLDMNSIGQSGSTIELENVMGYTGVNGGTVAANLQLNSSKAADGTEQSAFVVSNGYSHKTTADHVMTTFSGTVSGYGKMVYEKTLSNQYTGFAFSGDVSGWKGAFEMNGGKTFNLVFNGKATEINANISDISSNGTLNLRLGANAAMRVNGTVDVDSIIVTNNQTVSFSNTVETDSLSAAGSSLSFDAAAVVSGDMSAAALTLGASGSLNVGGTLSTELITMKHLSQTAPALTVGQFAAGDTIFSLSRENLDSLNLAHGESVVIARAGNDISQDFRAWVAEGSTSIDAVVYRYDLSVSGADVMVSKDYANWGTRVWYGNEWVGKESWEDYMAAGYDAVNGVEALNLGGAVIEAENLIIAPGDGAAVTELSNGDVSVSYTEVADGKLRIAEDTVLETVELAAEGRDIELQGELIVTDGQIGTLSGTIGDLTIDGELSVDSNVTLGSLDNAGSLDIGKHKLNVAGALTNGGNVIAGEVVAHNRTRNFAEFDTLVADKVTVTNTSTSASYTDNISVGAGSAIGELVAEMLEVRGGVVTLGRTDAATEQVLLALDLQADAALVLNQRTALTVTDELSATEGAELRLKQQASVSYGDMNISNRGTATQVVVNAYDLANDSIQELSHAHVAVGSSDDTSIDYKLTNSSVENTGSGKLYLTHAENTFSSISAGTGDIAVMNQALELNLDELVVGEGVSFSAYRGEVELPEQEAVVSVSQSVSFGAGAHINADLKLQSGVRVEMNGPVSMGSDLYLEHGMTLGGAMLETLTSTEQGQTVVLFSGIDRLYLCGEERTDAIALSHGVSASEYFVNLISSQERSYYLVYDNEVHGEGVLSIAVSGLAVPEPTSCMLGLMGLVAFTLRRRRK